MSTKENNLVTIDDISLNDLIRVVDSGVSRNLMVSTLMDLFYEQTELGPWLQETSAAEFNNILNNLDNWVDLLNKLNVKATKEEAEQGDGEVSFMTPLRTLQAIQYNAVPPGVVYYTAGTSAPEGYLVCDGDFVSRTTYSRLFDVIGTSYGIGNGSSTFNLPDLRDEFIRCANPGNGRDVGDTESDQFASHNHDGTTSTTGNHDHGYSFKLYGNGEDEDRSNPSASDGLDPGRTFSDDTSIAGAHSHTFTTNNTGGGETRPRNMALLPIIKY